MALLKATSILLVLLALSVVTRTSAVGVRTDVGTAFYSVDRDPKSGKWNLFTHDQPPNASQSPASGSFANTLLQTGWNVLKVETNAGSPNEDQAYAAGYFEGRLTYTQAMDHYNNYYLSPYQAPVPPEIVEYFENHVKWIEKMIADHSATSDFWYQTGLLWLQWNGLRDGLNDAAAGLNGTTWSKSKLLILSSMGDMFDLYAYFNVSGGLTETDASKGRKHWRDMSKKEFEMWVTKNSHCSALYKVTEDMQEIFFGHVSWFLCRTTMRIFKHYTLRYQGRGTVAQTISMSSYPGMLSSFDDYYLTDSGLVSIETSLGVYNYSMYVGNIYPQSLLYWERVVVANRMANGGKEWADIISRHNSGTYNNQWTILDLKKFTPGKPLPPDTLWLAEQLPGVVASQDVTEILSFGYYPSYNVPMNVTLFELSGQAAAVAIQGPEMTDYQTNVRAEIFRRDQAKVKDLDSFKFMMEYNDYEQDPLSQGNPVYAISARGDLDPHSPACFGAIDAKVSSYSMWKKGMLIHARSGLTPQQPIFGFNITSATADCTPHVGLPEMFAFDFQEMKPGN